MAVTTLEKYRQLKEDYIGVFSSEQGKRVFEDLCKRFFINRSAFSKEPTEHARNEGMRCVMLHIQSIQNLDLEKIVKQVEEYEKEN